MKRIKALNGYTIYQATEKDEKKYNGIETGYYYIYFSSDIKESGISANAEYFEYECGTIEEAVSNISDEESIEYAEAKESLEAESTCVTSDMIEERIEELKILKDAGYTQEEAKELAECGTLEEVVEDSKKAQEEAEKHNIKIGTIAYLYDAHGKPFFKVKVVSISGIGAEVILEVKPVEFDSFSRYVNIEDLQLINERIKTT